MSSNSVGIIQFCHHDIQVFGINLELIFVSRKGFDPIKLLLKIDSLMLIASEPFGSSVL